MRVRASFAAGYAALAWLGVALGFQDPAREELEFFEQRVRPILEQHCLKCHASTLERPKGGLVLDTRDGWMRGGDSGEAIAQGDPDASRLIRAVNYGDEELQMPPPGRLSDAEIAALEAWVRMGAPDPRTASASGAPARIEVDSRAAARHWAFQPITAPEPPAVRGESWVENDVDRFVLAELEARGWTPAPEADRRTLLRRASVDLTGLPPTPEEVAAFEADAAPDAWPRWIERLLASPHYGERQARAWLDLARYADSNGLDENLALGEAWRYRDWVVRALASDLPYDQFVVEQLAGDLLPGTGDARADFDRLIATGFLVLGPKMLAEQDKEKLVMDVVDEQLDVAGRAFLGLTIGCARCHDHKFDPIPTRDYYALAGVFKSTSTMANLEHVSRWRERELATPEQQAARDAHAAAVAVEEQAVADLRAEADRELQPRWRRELAQYLLAGTFAARRALMIEAEEFSRGNLAVDRERWGSAEFGIVHTQSPGTQFVEYDVTLAAGGEQVFEVRYASAEERPMRVLLNGQLVAERALGASTASFFLDGQTWQRVAVLALEPGRNVLRLESDGAVPHLERLVLAPAGGVDWALAENPWAAGLEPQAVRTAAVFLERSERVAGGDPHFGLWHVFAKLDDFDFAARATELTAKMRAERDTGAANLSPPIAGLLDGLPPQSLRELAGRYQTLFSSVDAQGRALQAKKGEQPAALADPDAEALRKVLHSPAGPFGLPQRAQEALYPEATRTRLAEHRAALDALAQSAPGPFERALAVQDGAIVDVPVHVRGSHLNLGPEPVPRGALALASACLEPPVAPAGASGRLELARWIVDPRHPLTARVAVNRIWLAHFGEGLVRTPSNFGLRGEAPSHPELLDWLAREFVRRGWSQKELHRLILGSRTYRMSCDFVARAAAVDPDNRLLWRQNRRRLDAESLRDAWLAVSGMLDRALGGSLLSTKNGDYVTNDQSADQARYTHPRRSLYLPIIRNAMYGLYTAFDYNDPSVPVDQRPQTTAAPQALLLMNAPLIAECSAKLADDVRAAGADDGARVESAWRRALARAPTAAERERALAFVREVRARTLAPEGPTAFPTAGQSQAAPAEPMEAAHVALADPDQQVWQLLCQTLLVCNEFLYLD